MQLAVTYARNANVENGMGNLNLPAGGTEREEGRHGTRARGGGVTRVWATNDDVVEFTMITARRSLHEMLK